MLVVFRPGEDRRSSILMMKPPSPTPSQERLLCNITELTPVFRSSKIQWMTPERCKFFIAAFFVRGPQNINTNDLELKEEGVLGVMLIHLDVMLEVGRTQKFDFHQFVCLFLKDFYNFVFNL